MKIFTKLISLLNIKKANKLEFATPIIEKNSSTTIVEKNPYNDFCVCLDPGHASSTRGKRSPKCLDISLDIEEWKFNREVVNYLKEMLKNKGFDVFITTDEERDGDTDVKLAERANRANQYIENHKKTGLFLSIHANADGMGETWTSANGWSAYTTKKQNNSDIFAEYLYKSAEDMFLPSGLRLRRDTSDGDSDFEKNFLVLTKANMPAVLTENFFYTNVNDTKYLMSESGKKMIAEMHFNGIINFIKDKYLNK